MAYEKKIQRGIELLDANFPGWEERVDLTDFDMGVGSRCVLSQAAGQLFYSAMRDLRPNSTDGERDRYAVKHGLMLGDNDVCDYDRLTEAWRKVIRERLTPDFSVLAPEPDDDELTDEERTTLINLIDQRTETLLDLVAESESGVAIERLKKRLAVLMSVAEKLAL